MRCEQPPLRLSAGVHQRFEHAGGQQGSLGGKRWRAGEETVFDDPSQAGEVGNARLKGTEQRNNGLDAVLYFPGQGGGKISMGIFSLQEVGDAEPVVVLQGPGHGRGVRLVNVPVFRYTVVRVSDRLRAGCGVNQIPGPRIFLLDLSEVVRSVRLS